MARAAFAASKSCAAGMRIVSLTVVLGFTSASDRRTNLPLIADLQRLKMITDILPSDGGPGQARKGDNELPPAQTMEDCNRRAFLPLQPLDYSTGLLISVYHGGGQAAP